jgi:RNA polymerase sigma-70 factor, ECF subfamily
MQHTPGAAGLMSELPDRINSSGADSLGANATGADSVGAETLGPGNVDADTLNTQLPGGQSPGLHSSGDEFVRLFSRAQPRLHAYILTMVPNWADAADILQETSSVMWRKFEQFERDSNFFAWACQIARFEVAAFRKRTKRQGLLFSDAFIAAVADTSEQLAATLEARQGFLVECLQQLRPRDREMLELRYQEEGTVGKIASHTGRNVEAVYKALQRIRRQLFECVERRSAEGAR